jgi:hypothetical protein
MHIYPHLPPNSLEGPYKSPYSAKTSKLTSFWGLGVFDSRFGSISAIRSPSPSQQVKTGKNA